MGNWGQNNPSKMREHRKKWYDSNKHWWKNEVNERQTKKRKEFQKWWQTFKSKLKCSNCGEDHIATLDFHHTNPNEKEYGVSTLVHSCNKEKILKEIDKCVVLCANCHHLHHFNEKQNEI